MRLTIFIDADDTLWANNFYFEEAIVAFTSYLDDPVLTPKEIHDRFDSIERQNRGNGTENFTVNLKQCFAEFRERDCTPGEDEDISGITECVLNHPVVPLDGVEETLTYLRERHYLRMVTKGPHAEQEAKIERSGLRHLFDDCSIVAEKNVNTYRELIAQTQATPSRTWMVGNSPRSDIIPALAAGIGAVLIPDPHPWALEHADLPVLDDRFHVREKFSDLQQLF